MTAKENGRPVRFGAVGGGGRYDDLVARFTGQRVPATGFSIGVSRLVAAQSVLGLDRQAALSPPVVVLALDAGRMGDYFAMADELRRAGVRAEAYLGASGMKAQLKRGVISPTAVSMGQAPAPVAPTGQATFAAR